MKPTTESCAVCGKTAPCVPHDIEPGRTPPCIVSLCSACLAAEIDQVERAAAKAALLAKKKVRREGTVAASAEEPSLEQLEAESAAAYACMKAAGNAWRDANQRVLDWYGRNPSGRVDGLLIAHWATTKGEGR